MSNRLAQETSPYLQQHADNPVDWYPWGAEALGRAQQENKPILLSVGYSACHWCHVMAHESFEDPAVAAVMNRNFVNIKVDREERPDLDQIYQSAHHMLSQHAGGWPLTMFLAPDQRPFFSGTYFPKTARYNLPGFADLLEKIAAAYREQPDAIAAQSESLAGLFARSAPAAPAADLQLSPAPVADALSELNRIFDPVHGGFGGAPKFPHPAELKLCLSEGVRSGDSRAADNALFTLRKMAEGGIYDHLGGGFSRYSVDQQWMIPHFEKMLYDNGPLLRLCADAWLITADTLFARVCEQTAGWVMREMQAPEGGYYSSLDADSEHEEGKFYVWSREALREILSETEYALVAAHYGVDQPPNFEGRHWHLRVVQPLAQIAAVLGVPLKGAQVQLDVARAKLLAAREGRVRPGRDEKILTSWNALMIHGMARAGRAFGRQDWIDSARRALDFVRTQLWRKRRLLATYKDGKAHLNAYLDDHVFLLAALLEMMQTDYRAEDMQMARELADAVLDRFEDRAAGGFFFTSSDHEQLIHRPKPGPDNATPSGNGIAALTLQRLGHLLGEPRYLESAERALRLFFPEMQRHASAYASLCAAVSEYAKPPAIAILRGSNAQLEDAARALAKQYFPATLTLALADDEAGLPDAMNKPQRPGVNAWVCHGVSCLPPIQDLAELAKILANGK